ncbi:unnamed protein product [marine sediment metagenome]|uniref:Uncharacterized protein n=1 Tax=marine sediment metagenome TaxID=412755 RepID=X1VV25_9ZZZZ
MEEEGMFDVCELLDGAKWKLDGLTNIGEDVLDDFDLGRIYAALDIVIDVEDRFYERNILDRERIMKHLDERRQDMGGQSSNERERH